MGFNGSKIIRIAVLFSIDMILHGLFNIFLFCFQ